MHNEEDITLGGFSFDRIDVHIVKIDGDFVINSVALDMMKKMSYMPSMGLGANNQKVSEFLHFPINSHRYRLGYDPAKEDGDILKERPIRFVKSKEGIWGSPSSFGILKLTLSCLVSKFLQATLGIVIMK